MRDHLGPLSRARVIPGQMSDDVGWKSYGKIRVCLVKSGLCEEDEEITIRHFRLKHDDEPNVPPPPTGIFLFVPCFHHPSVMNAAVH